MFRAYTLSQQDLLDKLHIYEKAKEAYAWYPKKDIPWNEPWGLDENEEKFAWQLASQSVSTEEAGLLISGRLLQEADDAPTRLCLATAVSDEAKHCEVFARFSIIAGGYIDEPAPFSENLLDKLLELDPVGRFLVHTLMEGLAVDQFTLFCARFKGTILNEIYQRVIRDEARHVGMGIEYLSGIANKMSNKQIEELYHKSETVMTLTGLDQIGSFDGLGKLLSKPGEQIRKSFLYRNRKRLNNIFNGKEVIMNEKS